MVELSVRDLGVIRALTLHLGPGMTALTGETGAGKTLLVEAIELLTGGRADPVLVRPGAAEAVVEGRFVVGDEERVLARVVPASARSRAYVDGRMAPTSRLEEISQELVDLHGQHGHQSLLRPAAQRAALDGFAGIDLSGLRAARTRVRGLERALAELGGDSRARARELDLLSYQLDEITSAGLGDPDEDERLAAEEDLLASAAEHRARAEAAQDALSGEAGAVERLGQSLAALSGRDPLEPVRRRLAGLAAEVDDLTRELRLVAEGLAEDPERLEWVRQRRALLRDLTRKYGDGIPEVLAFAVRAEARRAELASRDQTVARFESELTEARREVEAAEEQVRRRRQAAAPDLAAQIGEHLRSLALPSASLQVEVSGGAGEEVAFLFSANPGAPVLPLAKIASGGELARTMLATRLILSSGPPVLVFDEVDAGVGGEAALAVGRALASLAEERQVLVVTHLAQVAAFADQQVAVRKVVDGQETRTETESLAPEARVVELSRMLAGQPASVTGRQHASELLDLARRRRPSAGRRPREGGKGA